MSRGMNEIIVLSLVTHGCAAMEFKFRISEYSDENEKSEFGTLEIS
jgi:hypothetical protein